MRYFPPYDHGQCVAETTDDGFRHICPPNSAVDLLAIAGYAFLALVLWFCVQDSIANVREFRRQARLRELIDGTRSGGDRTRTPTHRQG